MKGPPDPGRWNLYVVSDRRLSGGRSHLEVARLAFEGGAEVFQIRDKEMSPGEIYKESLSIVSLSKKLGRLTIVNDRIDIAVAVKAAGAHVGWDDFDYLAAREVLPRDYLLGCSVGNLEELEAAVSAGADYLGVGPVFEARGTKPDAGEPVGLTFIEEVRKRTDLPIVAIGGITAENAPSVIRAGADCVAVVSAVVASPDIAKAARKIREAVLQAKGKMPKH
ncbi:MAG: thiamine phosphate synthase [Deltaproteobacteria bacterium]|nr:MAG: thiamine phosphate synthase [Deltaproteobacteria bacterium]